MLQVALVDKTCIDTFCYSKSPTAVVYAFIRGVSAMWNLVAEMLVIHTLLPAGACYLTRTTGGAAVLLITSIHAVCFAITSPGLRHTLVHSDTAKFIGPTCWEKKNTGP